MPPPLNVPDMRAGDPAPAYLRFATVDDESPVVFDEELGPLVSVTTHPEGTPLVCRVAMKIAGRGEADYDPFVPGDELVVGIVEGHPRAGGVVLGRLCNGIDRFPKTVAGQDTTKNAFGFTRSVAARVEERGGPIFTRQATTGAFFGVGPDGTITLRNGDASALQLSPDVLGVQSGDGAFLAQLDLSGGRFTVQAKDALLVLASSSASPERSAIVVPGTLAISANAQPAAEHAISAEAVVNLLNNLFVQIGIQNPGPVLGVGLAALAVPILSATIAQAAIVPQLPPLALALFAAFSAALPKPPAVPAQGQLAPGLGCSGVLIG